MNNNLAKNVAIWLLIGFLVFLIVDFYQRNSNSQPTQPLSYSNFLTEVKNGNVSRVEIRGNNIKGELNNGSIFTTYSPNDQGLISRLEQSSVEIVALPLESNSPGLLDILISWFPMLLLIGVWIFFMRQMQSGSGRAMGFGRSRAKLLNENNIANSKLNSVKELSVHKFLNNGLAKIGNTTIELANLPVLSKDTPNYVVPELGEHTKLITDEFFN